MRTLKLGLTDEQRAKRRFSLGGSDANILMSRDDAAVLALWQEKRGEVPPSDLSDVLPVQMGSWTEEFNRYWYERNTGRLVTNEGLSCVHPDFPWMTCSLDGETTTESGEPAIWEGKHVNAFAKEDETIAKYQPQLHWNAGIRGLDHAILSVFYGTLRWEFYAVEIDLLYWSELFTRARKFWACVQSGETPVHMPAVEAPKTTKFREADMGASNSWHANAADWLAHRDTAKAFKKAEAEIKGLVEPDVGRAFGAGIQVKRSKAGALSISEMKS